MDVLDKALQYRSNIVSFEDVRKLHNSTMKEMTAVSRKHLNKKQEAGANGAIVFAIAGPDKPEFGLVTNYSDDFDPSADTKVLLRYADPVGVVMIAAGVHNDEAGHVFKTFKGKEWAQKFAKEIIDQANNTVPIYKFA